MFAPTRVGPVLRVGLTGRQSEGGQGRDSVAEKSPERVFLHTPLKTVIGVRAAKQLAEKLSLVTVGELLRYYPRKYDRRGRLTDLSGLKVGERVTVWATVRSIKERQLGPGRKVKSITNVVIGDHKTELTCTFFNRWNLARFMPVGTDAMFSGTVSKFNGNLQISSPQIAVVSFEGSTQPALAGAVSDLINDKPSVSPGKDAIDVIESFPGGLIPVYPLSEGITGALMQRCVRTVLSVLDAVADPLPDVLLAEHGLVDLAHALHDIHRPPDEKALDAAIARLRYDEALSIQLVLARRRAEMRNFPAEPCPRVEGGLLSAFDEDLPFTLTDGQKEVGEVIANDLATIHPMNRLLQGEVGSGKTVVALRAMLQVIDSGRQAVLLAPTEVLAAQHARSLRSVLGQMGNGGELGSLPGAIKITLLTGSMTAGARREALLDIASGQAGIAVGTHALLSDGVFFAELGLIVIDEQHRFGVEQRNALRNKHPAGNPPHVLVMTATPIPRTVAMTVYGDLDTSTLSELPKGRSPISTTVVPAAEKPQWVDRAWSRVHEEVAAGHQVYIVCPKIGDDAEVLAPASGKSPEAASRDDHDPLDDGLDDPDDEAPGEDERRPPLAVLDVARDLAEGPLSGLRLGILHGRMLPADKDAVMTGFAARRLDVLVATTVIEVGVDVANATMMIVLDAERFGMSQLHQLRGRVGRGEAAGVCLLITEAPENSVGRARLDAVAKTNDGFKLAEADLELRREGNVLGTSQAGKSSGLRQLSLIRDREVIEAAREDAMELVGQDPTMAEHPGLAAMVAAVIDEEGQEFLDKG
ncbi:ATP-dependent DNA helicase RecG [Nakamurella sp. UYEF19]|uniref:ATP-dependent DNA helicase RecG n=1 Tax=Nakamurella sp. UYEF19 TaxID=1756392 RepID=UPI0033971EBC